MKINIRSFIFILLLDSGILENLIINNKIFSAPILQSTSNPWPPQTHFAPQKQQKQKYMFNGLEEFERKRDLFDLLELRSLDDRRELEKLLLNGTTGIGGGNH